MALRGGALRRVEGFGAAGSGGAGCGNARSRLLRRAANMTLNSYFRCLAEPSLAQRVWAPRGMVVPGGVQQGSARFGAAQLGKAWRGPAGRGAVLSEGRP